MTSLKKIAGLNSITSNRRAAPVTAPPSAKAEGRPPITGSRPTLFPQGPAILGLGARRTHGTGGPGIKPVDFPGTEPEWVWYFASARLHDDPKDPRVGPFTGGRVKPWFFQVPENPDMPREAGSSIADFLYQVLTGAWVVRIQGFYWHTAAAAAQQARDAYLANFAGNVGTRIESVEDGEFMGDATGATAVRLLADILAGRSRIGAITGGLAMPPRYDPELQKGPL